MRDFELSFGKELDEDLNGRRIITVLLTLTAAGCFGYFAYYYLAASRNAGANDSLADLKKNMRKEPQVVHYREPKEDDTEPEVLAKYKTLLDKNKNLIGWIKIDDTNIDYPVMKSINGNGEYYLDHNFDGKEDRNGTVFMDDACDPVSPCDNLILYGHNMKSGEMFGQLDYYKNQKFYENHKQVRFDTIYREGIYEVMFAFQSRVYSEAEITFKYYQFIECNSEQEFNSGIEAMAEMSLYDTGVTAEYGDELLTLSTCDYDEPEGRFVVVCKKVA